MPLKQRSPLQQELLRRRRANTLTPNPNLGPTAMPQQLAPNSQPHTNSSTAGAPQASSDNKAGANPTPVPPTTRSNPRPAQRHESDMRRFLRQQRRAQLANERKQSTSAPSTAILATNSTNAHNTSFITTTTTESEAMESAEQIPQPAPLRRMSSLSPAASTFEPPLTTSYGTPLKRYKALLVGIGYGKHRFLRPLPGCRTDVRNMFDLLTGPLFRFPTDNVHVLCDEIDTLGSVKVEQPTRITILRELNWLTKYISPGDSVIFFFAGHGDFVVDFSGDEIESGLDQVCKRSSQFQAVNGKKEKKKSESD